MNNTPQQHVVPEPLDLAEAIRQVSIGMTRLTKSGLNRNAIIVLLHDYTKVGKRDIERVLSGLSELSKTYCVKAQS